VQQWNDMNQSVAPQSILSLLAQKFYWTSGENNWQLCSGLVNWKNLQKNGND
jgi:hypothetical protein